MFFHLLIDCRILFILLWYNPTIILEAQNCQMRLYLFVKMKIFLLITEFENPPYKMQARIRTSASTMTVLLVILCDNLIRVGYILSGMKHVKLHNETLCWSVCSYPIFLLLLSVCLCTIFLILFSIRSYPIFLILLSVRSRPKSHCTF